jgi:hypothetical protein
MKRVWKSKKPIDNQSAEASDRHLKRRKEAHT